MLENAYLNSLKVMKENNLRSIAFPSISTGIYGYPHVSLFLQNRKTKEILGACLYGCPAHGEILLGEEQGFCGQGLYHPHLLNEPLNFFFRLSSVFSAKKLQPSTGTDCISCSQLKPKTTSLLGERGQNVIICDWHYSAMALPCYNL